MNSKRSFNTDWRKVASTIYRKPVDSKIFGEAEFDVTELEEFISRKRKEGLKVTLTHVFVLMLARGIRSVVPEFNTYWRRGRIVEHSTIDAMVSVLQSDEGMGSVKVKAADTLNLKGIEAILQDEILKSRKGDENTSMQKKSILTSLPWPLRQWFFNLYTILVIRWGISIPLVGLSADSFGSFVVTNIGSIGIDKGLPALLPSANMAFGVVLGSVKKKPVVVNDKIVIRKMMDVTIAIDHRVADASHGGKMLRFIKHLISHPEELL